jgi:inner membrane protein
MMARAGLEKTSVRGAGMMMLAANVPDIDAVTWFDRITYLDFHRSYTHAFAFAPVMAVIPLLLVRAKFTWKAYAASIAGVLSHLLLDWTNPYGIQLYLPFSHRRTMLDLTNIIDPWIWLILFVGLFAPALVGLVGSELRGRTVAGPRRAWGIAALLLLVGYEGLRFASHERALAIMSSHLYDGAATKNVLAVPIGVNPFVWRGVVVTQAADRRTAVRILAVNVRGGFDPSSGRDYYEAPPSAAIEAARQTHDFQVFQRFSQAQFWQTSRVDRGTQVLLIDLRFGDPGNPGFAAVSAVVQ